MTHRPVRSGTLLDVGNKPGFLPFSWQKPAGGRLIDCSAAMIETASHNAREAGVDALFRQEDIHAASFPDGSFDYIVCRNVTWILYNPEKAFREWFRLLKPGGRLLYVDANWYYVKDEAEQVVILTAMKRNTADCTAALSIRIVVMLPQIRRFSRRCFLITSTGRSGTGNICRNSGLLTCRLRHG